MRGDASPGTQIVAACRQVGAWSSANSLRYSADYRRGGAPVKGCGGARIFGTSRCWRSVTPFLASGHLKAAGYPGEVRRLLNRRGLDAADILVDELESIDVDGNNRRAIHFYRFRSRGREVQPDPAGALLRIRLPEQIEGPLAIGYGSHFGLGMFGATSDE